MSSTPAHPLSDLPNRLGAAFLPRSVTPVSGGLVWLEQDRARYILRAALPDDPVRLEPFADDCETGPGGLRLVRCPADARTAAALRAEVDGLRPRPLGLVTSAGFGDRLGLATPGHVRALRDACGAKEPCGIAPIFAQQSIREMRRTHRTPEDVMTDATFGALAGGWTGPVGADADHLKTTDDIDACRAAGFSLFTIDPGDYVDGAADTDAPNVLERKFAGLPWNQLETTPGDLRRQFERRAFDLGDHALTVEQADLVRAAVKYGRAVAHVATLARHLIARGAEHELEVSVDETDTPTSPAEHLYIAVELARLGVRWVSLAPRFVGRFEKGVDYIGDPQALAAQLKLHAAIARNVGAGATPYKLSLHSGSDKFSVYPLICEATAGLVHLKTAGTSYLEALRVLARHEPALFREILLLGRKRYAEDRQTYHVSAELTKVPAAEELKNADLPGLLEDFHARQVLHVTYGSALDQFGQDLHAALRRHTRDYEETLARHFGRHLESFAAHACS